eukprot:TRINITY_DN1706_c0_g1_i1.p2 TRINITY_DN1706_c0_g1~~TRINITY_DN1706_c0_g1_i1.p2  ORF type:complete len:144 (-),score=23.95 TRINITY_DN1706_c0_g1_i1:81-512(-)
MNVLKEASYLKQGDIKRINALGVSETNQIWDSFKASKFEPFWKMNEKLSDWSSIVRVPVRICKGDRIFQEPIVPQTEDGQEKTLGQILLEQFEDLFRKRDDGSIESSCKVIVQGIQPSLDSSIVWLSKNLSHPDNFLYIIVRS